jgi:hypothetical protein
MSAELQTVVRSAEWVIQQITAGLLPDIMYWWMPGQLADHLEAANLMLVYWFDPTTDMQCSIADMTGMLLVASRAQWEEACTHARRRRRQRLLRSRSSRRHGC